MISVIVPVYRVEQYLDACIESILGQTFQDFELILVDDGSPDNCGEICDRYAGQDARIRVVHQENRGLSGARNTGTGLAEGKYITYIDSDDRIGPEYLEVLYNNAVEYRAQVSVCGYCLVWEHESGQSRNGQNKKKGEQDFHTLVYTGRQAAEKIVKESTRAMITAWGKLYHRDLKPLLVYPEGKTHEDEFVTYRVFYAARRVAVSNRPLYHYLQRSGSIMNDDFREKRLDKIRALREAVTFFRENNDRELERYARKRYLTNLQIAWYRTAKFLPDRKELSGLLLAQWKLTYGIYRKEILECGGFMERLSIRIFSVSPRVYRVMAEVYLKLFPEV